MKDSIKVYSSASCPRCVFLKNRLDKAGIEYLEEQDNYQIILDKGFRTLPVLQVGDQFFKFDEAMK